MSSWYRAVGHAVAHALVGVEGRVQGVVPDDLQVGAAADVARERRQLAEERAQQRRLAGAVRAHEAEPVAAHDAEVEALHDGRGAVARGQARGLEHDAPRALGLGDAHADRARRVAAIAALRAQLLEGLDARLVAVALRLHVRAAPRLLLREQLVGGDAAHGLVVGALLLAAEVVLVVAGPRRQPAAVELEDARREPAQERAVVRDEQRRLLALEQVLLEPLDARDVEVVRRLVEQQQVGVRRQRLREQHAAREAGRQPRDVGVRVEAEALEQLVEPRPGPPGLLARRHRGGDQVARGPREAPRHLLRQPGDGHALAARHVAVVDGDLAGEHAHERGLARRVAPEEAEALPFLDLEADAVEERGPAVGERDAVESDQGHPATVGGRPGLAYFGPALPRAPRGRGPRRMAGPPRSTPWHASRRRSARRRPSSGG
ncbi:MAG: hypothetical protein V9G22_10010 [Ottowia sp.]